MELTEKVMEIIEFLGLAMIIWMGMRIMTYDMQSDAIMGPVEGPELWFVWNNIFRDLKTKK